MSAEQYIASAKAGLTSIRSILNTPNWRSGIPNVRTCISYINSSQLMLNKDRMEERLWILNEVQQFAYHDPDAGGVTELASWCELEYNRILAYDPNHVRALKGRNFLQLTLNVLETVFWQSLDCEALGQAWLWKSQFWLAKIHHEDSNEDDDRVAERRRHTPNYVEARAALIPAVDFFVRVVECASQQRCLTGELLVLVSIPSDLLTILLQVIYKDLLTLWCDCYSSALKLPCLLVTFPLQGTHKGTSRMPSSALRTLLRCQDTDFLVT